MGCSGCNGCRGNKPMMKLIATDEYDRLYNFFEENGLEVPDEEPESIGTDVVKAYKLVNAGCTSLESLNKELGEQNGGPATEMLVGGIILAKRQGQFIIDGIAVDSAYRNGKIGGLLLDKAVHEVKQQGGDCLYLVARAPVFFAKHGFTEIDRKDAPEFFECFECPQYQRSCYPKVMKLEIK